MAYQVLIKTWTLLFLPFTAQKPLDDIFSFQYMNELIQEVNIVM